MNLNDDVVYRCLRRVPLHQLHPGRSRGLVCHHDRLHRPPPDVWDVVIFRIPLQMSANRPAKIDRPMTSGYGVDGIDSACRQSTVRNKHLLRTAMGQPSQWRSAARHPWLEKISTERDVYSRFRPGVAMRSRLCAKRRHHIWGEPDVLGERIESRFAIGRHLFRL